MDIQWKKEWTTPSIIGAVSFVAGVGVGYGIRAYLNHRLIKQIRETMESVEEEQPEYDMVGDQVIYREEETVTYIHEVIREEEDHEAVEESKQNHPSNGIHSSIFTTGFEDDWDYEEEAKSRTPEKPYIIHVDEFMLKEAEGYSQTTLTYYEGDDVLVDEADTPVYQPHHVVGELNFGHGSKDQSICYVRNDKLQAEYEIILDHGYYQIEVLGEEIEAKLTLEKDIVPKFRED